MNETVLSPPKAGESEGAEIVGYANVTARDSRVLHDKNGRAFIERIMPGAFRRAIERDTDGSIFLDLDHDGKQRAVRSDGTLEVREDNIGLKARAKVTDEETVRLYNEGKLKGWSFTFKNPRYRIKTDDEGMEHRDAYDLELKAVTLISDRRTPAYSGTQIDREAPDTDVEVRFTITDEVQEAEQDESTQALNPTLEMMKNIITILKLEGEQ